MQTLVHPNAASPRVSRKTALLAQTFTTAVIAATAVVVIGRVQQSMTLGELLLIAIVAGALSYVIASLARGPGQFCIAAYERLKYLIVVPFSMALALLAIFARLFVVLLKLLIFVVTSLIYVLFPLDLIPDIIPLLGQIDDLLIVIGLGTWAFSAGARDGVRNAIVVFRPTTPFP